MANTVVWRPGIREWDSAPIGFASPGQINFQFPFNTPIGSTSIAVIGPGGQSALSTVSLTTYAPGLTNSPAIMHSNNSPVNAGSPATASETLTVRGFGFGPTIPAVAAGTPGANPLPSTAAAPTILVDGSPIAATIVSSGLDLGTPGLYKIQFTLGSTVAQGNHNLQVSIGGVASNSLPLAMSGPVIGSVLSGGSFSTSLSPGIGGSIFGTDLMSGAACTVPGGTAWPTTLCGVQVLVAGVPSPIGFVSPSQINFQFSYTLPTGPTTVRIMSPAGQSSPFGVLLTSYAPGLGGIVKTSNFSALSAANPVSPNEGLTVFGFGFGATNPAIAAGVPATSPFPVTTATPTVLVDGQPAAHSMTFSGLTSGNPGLYRFDFSLGAGLTQGNHTLALQIGGVVSNSLPLFVAGPSVSSVVDTFGSQPKLSPGGAATLYGLNLTDNNGTCSVIAPNPALTTQCGAQILFNGTPVPVIFASPGQVNFQLPFGAALGAATIVARRPALGTISATLSVQLSAFSPGLGTFSPGQGAFFHVSNGQPVNAANPAKPGESIRIIGGGLGPTTPSVLEGQRGPASAPFAATNTTPSVTVDGLSAAVTSSILNTGIAQYEVTFTVPITTLPGTRTVALSIGGAASNAVNISISGGQVWVSRIATGVLSTIDGATNTIVGSNVTVHDSGVTTPINSSRSLAMTPDGTRVYVAPATGKLWVVDTATRVATQTGLTVSGTAITISPDGKRGFLRPMADTVAIIDTNPNSGTYHQPIGPIGPITGANRYAISPDGKRLYVGGTNSLTVVDIGAPSPAILSTITGLGTALNGLAVTPDGKRIYVTNSNLGSVSVIDTTSNTEVLPRIPVGTTPFQVAFTPDGKKAYVTNSGSQSVSVIDTDFNTVLTTITTGIGGIPVGITLNIEGTRAYVANNSGQSVSVIDVATNAVIGSPIAVTDGPRFVALSRPVNTAIGANSTAAPTDATTGNSPVSMTFNNVASGGTTTLTSSTTGPPPPAGFQVAGTTYNLQNS